MANTSNRWSLEQGILNQAFGERGKLRELRRDPRAVLERALGQSIPAEIQVEVAFDKPRKIHQVVPHTGHTMLGAIEPPTGDDAIPGMRGLAAATAHRAASDPDFRAKLIADAKGLAKSGLSKVELPDDLEIVVLQEDPGTIWLTVPLVGRPNLRPSRRAGGKREGKAPRKQ
jgi:hypothetical protein